MRHGYLKIIAIGVCGILLGCKELGQSEIDCGADQCRSSYVTSFLSIDHNTRFTVGGFQTLDYQMHASLVRITPAGKFIQGSSSGFLDQLNGYLDSNFNHAVIQPDGKILAIGSGGLSSGLEMILMRFQVDGSVDENFGTSGLVHLNLKNTNAHTAHADTRGVRVAVSSSGEIFALMYNQWRIEESVATNQYGTDINVAKFDSSGQLDSSFGVNGIVTTKAGSQSGYVLDSVAFPKDMALLANGKIVVAGYSFVGGSVGDPSVGNRFTVVRYNVDGSLDSGFGTGGIARFGSAAGYSSSELFKIAIQADGKIIAGGYRDINLNNQWTSYQTLARLLPNGNLDVSFGNGGFAEVSSNQRTAFYDIKIDGSNIFGVATKMYDGKSQILKFNGSGVLDSSFGGSGVLDLSSLPGAKGYYFQMELGASNSILLGGTRSDGSGFNFLDASY